MRSPSLWSDPTIPQDARSYWVAEVHIVGTPAVAYTPQRSPNGVDWFDVSVVDGHFNTVSSALNAEGQYTFVGNAYVRLSGGSGSTVYIGMS